MKYKEIYNSLQEEAKNIYRDYEERIKYWIGDHCYDISTGLSPSLTTHIRVNYMVSRSMDYNDYKTYSEIPLEYFDCSDYKDFKDSLDQAVKLKQAERKRQTYLNEIETLDKNIENMKTRKNTILEYLK